MWREEQYSLYSWREPWRDAGHKGQVGLLAQCLKATRPLRSLCQRPNFRSTYHAHCPFSIECLCWYKEPICVRTPSARTGAIMESELSSISYSGMSAGLISMQRQTVTINVQVFKETNLIHDDHQCFQLIIQ